MSCPVHHVALRHDQTYTDARPDGLAPLGVEVMVTVRVMACPVAGCGFTSEEVDR